MPLGKFVRSLAGIEAEIARQAFIEFQDTGKHTEEQVFFVNCIVDYIEEHGNLEQQEMADDEFDCGLVEVFCDNIVEFQRIMKIVADINANAMPMAA